MKVTQSCLTLHDPVDYTVHGILQARILEWVAFPFSGGSSQTQGLNPEIEPRAPALQADSSPAEAQRKPRGQERVESNYLSEGSEHQNQFRALGPPWWSSGWGSTLPLQGDS